MHLKCLFMCHVSCIFCNSLFFPTCLYLGFFTVPLVQWRICVLYCNAISQLAQLSVYSREWEWILIGTSLVYWCCHKLNFNVVFLYIMCVCGCWSIILLYIFGHINWSTVFTIKDFLKILGYNSLSLVALTVECIINLLYMIMNFANVTLLRCTFPDMM